MRFSNLGGSELDGSVLEISALGGSELDGSVLEISAPSFSEVALVSEVGLLGGSTSAIEVSGLMGVSTASKV